MKSSSKQFQTAITNNFSVTIHIKLKFGVNDKYPQLHGKTIQTFSNTFPCKAELHTLQNKNKSISRLSHTQIRDSNCSVTPDIKWKLYHQKYKIQKCK
jgi:hypothetical protein